MDPFIHTPWAPLHDGCSAATRQLGGGTAAIAMSGNGTGAIAGLHLNGAPMAVNTSPTFGRFLLAMSQAPSGGGIFKCDHPMKLFSFSPKLSDGT